MLESLRGYLKETHAFCEFSWGNVYVKMVCFQFFIIGNNLIAMIIAKYIMKYSAVNSRLSSNKKKSRIWHCWCKLELIPSENPNQTSSKCWYVTNIAYTKCFRGDDSLKNLRCISSAFIFFSGDRKSSGTWLNGMPFVSGSILQRNTHIRKQKPAAIP